MHRMFVSTVGISLLTNSDWRRGSPLPSPQEIDDRLESLPWSESCAELNTLGKIQLCENDRVRLLCSSTDVGQYCGERLKEFLSKRCRKVEMREVNYLGYDNTHFMQYGLKKLVDLAIEAHQEAISSQLEPIYCATGGFKAETAVLFLIGALLNVEAYYVHEYFKEIVKLPKLPLRWDHESVIANREFYEYFNDDARPANEAESWLRKYSDLRHLVIEEGGLVTLNSAGELIYKAAQEKELIEQHPPTLAQTDRHPEQKIILDKAEHHRPRIWRQVVEKLANQPFVSLIRYDRMVKGGDPIQILDSDDGAIGVRIEGDDLVLPLRVETTAKGPEQSQRALQLVHDLRLLD